MYQTFEDTGNGNMANVVRERVNSYDFTSAVMRDDIAYNCLTRR